MSRRFLFTALFAAIVLTAGAGLAQEKNLTGVWHTSTGAIFYVRQIGAEIWWYGRQAPNQPRWTNVAAGRLEGNVIRVRWADVPQAGSRNSGSLGLTVAAPNHLVVSEDPNDFISADWFR